MNEKLFNTIMRGMEEARAYWKAHETATKSRCRRP